MVIDSYPSAKNTTAEIKAGCDDSLDAAVPGSPTANSINAFLKGLLRGEAKGAALFKDTTGTAAVIDITDTGYLTGIALSGTDISNPHGGIAFFHRFSTSLKVEVSNAAAKGCIASCSYLLD